MSLKWIKVTDNLETGVRLINRGVTPRVINSILTRIREGEANNQLAFTENNIEELKTLLKIDEEENVHIILQTITHIFRQSCKVILKPTDLFKQLSEKIGLEDTCALEFVKHWCEHTNNDFGDIRNKLKVENLSWELNVQSADQIDVKQSVPVARILFELSKSLGVENNEKEKVVIEFDQSELTEFYNNLEKIQIKLDNINNV